MRLLLVAAQLLTVSILPAYTAPTSSHFASGKDLTSLDRLENASSSRQPVDKGKWKLTDTDAGLDAYLARKEPRRYIGVSIGTSRQKATSSAPRSDSETQHLDTHHAKPQKEKRRGAKSDYRGRVLPYDESIDWEDRIRRQGWRAKLQMGRREAFDQAWKDQGLHLQMDPVELADRVLALRKEDGIYSTSSNAIAARLVKAKGNKAYTNRYLARMTQLIPYMSAETKRIENDPILLNLDPKKQTTLALEETFKAVAKNDKKRKSRATSHTTDYVKKMEKVGKVVEQYIQSKGLDFHKMPLQQLASETRGLSSEAQMDQRLYTRILYDYIREKRGDPNEDLAAVTRAHKKHRG